LRSINEGRLGVDARLRDSLAQMAKGRAIVIDYFASRRCSVVIGDLTGDFRLRHQVGATSNCRASKACGSSQRQGFSLSWARRIYPGPRRTTVRRTPRLRPQSPRTLDRLPGRARGAVL